MKKLLRLMVITIILSVASIAVAANVTFRWDANTETDLWGYKLYQAETAGGPYTRAQVEGEGNLVKIIPLSLLADQTNPEYRLENVADGTHYWVLTARDVSNNESGFSNEVTTSIDSTPPVPPNGLSVWEVIVAFVKKIVSWFFA